MEMWWRKEKYNLLLITLLFLVGVFFISGKEGFHMDEMLSFELSNAEFTPWIVPKQPVGRLEQFLQNEVYADNFGETTHNLFTEMKDVFKNKGNSKLLSYKAEVFDEPVWLSAEDFQDYLTVNKKDRFHLSSVYFNVKDDNHPPVHFMLLHLISRLFSGRAEAWMGCLLNLCFLLGVVYLMIKLSAEVFGTETVGRLAGILYFCSMAGVQTLLLIRMYALLTFFCFLELYLHYRKYRQGIPQKGNKLWILVTVCGFLTQYYFVIFMLFLAIAESVLLYKKDKKQMLLYYRTMGISAVSGLAIFPFSVADVLYSGRGVESLEKLGGGFGDFLERCGRFLTIIGTENIGSILVFIALLLLSVPAFLSWKKKKTPGLSLFVLPAVGFFLVVAKIAPYFEDRYMMPVFPLLAFGMGTLLWFYGRKLLHAEKWREPVLYLVAFLFCIPGVFLTTPSYQFKGYEQQMALSEEYENLPVVCVYQGVGYYQNLKEFEHYRETLLVTKEEWEEREKDEVLEKTDALVVLLKSGLSEEAVSEKLLEEYGLEKEKTLLENGVHGDKISIYRRKG